MKQLTTKGHEFFLASLPPILTVSSPSRFTWRVGKLVGPRPQGYCSFIDVKVPPLKSKSSSISSSVAVEGTGMDGKSNGSGSLLSGTPD